MAKALETNTVLLELNLVGTAVFLCKGVLDEASSSFAENNIGREGAIALAKMLEKNSKLERLYLNGNAA